MKEFLVLILLGLPLGAFAQAWPQKPLKVIVPFPPGGVTDSVARITAEWLTQRLGQPVVPENRPGASGAIAADLVARADPDGYTLFSASTPQLSILPHVQKITYDPLKDFVPVTSAVRLPGMLAAHPSFAPNTIAELIALAKQNQY